MYEPLKRLALSVLQAPTEAPEPPAGSHDSVQIFRASPRYLSYRMLGFWLHAAFVLGLELVFLGVSAATGQFVVSALAVVVAIVIFVHLCLQYVATRLDFDMRYYVVTDRAVRVRQGAWLVREMTITHANVQNLRVVQGPIERLFGISTLEIDTAGGGGGKAAESGAMAASHTVRMTGIENAREIRDRILSHLRARGGGTGLGDLDDHADHRADRQVAVTPGADWVDAAARDALRSVRDAARALRATAEGRPGRTAG